MEEVGKWMEELDRSSKAKINAKCCRICHELEYESGTKLEAPCSCTGTLKYAHRECIQRWCDEKGNVKCEICLQVCFELNPKINLENGKKTRGNSGWMQRYEAGYTAIPKQANKLVPQPQPLDDVLTIGIRSSLQVPRREEVDDDDVIALSQCSSTADTVASYCKTAALLFTALLLLRQLLEVLSGGPHYPFSPATIIILRSCGVIIPMCIIIRTITALQNSIRRHRYFQAALIREEEADDEEQALQR